MRKPRTTYNNHILLCEMSILRECKSPKYMTEMSRSTGIIWYIIKPLLKKLVKKRLLVQIEKTRKQGRPTITENKICAMRKYYQTTMRGIEVLKLWNLFWSEYEGII